MISAIQRFYNEALCAFLGLAGLWILIWPLSRRLGALPNTWRRAWYLFPIGLALLAAAAAFQWLSSARLGATLIIAAVIALSLAVMAIIEHRRKP